VRISRLIKLIRLGKFQRIYVRMVTRVSISHETAVKLKVILAVLLVCHWLACVMLPPLAHSLHARPAPATLLALAYTHAHTLAPSRPHHKLCTTPALASRLAVADACAYCSCVFALSAAMHHHPSETYWGRNGFCGHALGPPPREGPLADGLVASGTAEVDKPSGFLDQCGIRVKDFYVACFTWAMLIVTGSGGTEGFPTPGSTAENMVVTLINMVADAARLNPRTFHLVPSRPSLSASDSSPSHRWPPCSGPPCSPSSVR
jgi:hypothetical protein